MSIATLCVDCLDACGYDNCCEDGCTQSVDHTGTCHPGRATRCDDCGARGFLKEVTIAEGDDPNPDGCDCADCHRTINGTDPYDHSLAKDTRNAAVLVDEECLHCGYPILAGSGAVVRCDMCGVFCCEDHHQRHPAYARHDVAANRSAARATRAARDAAALDNIAHMLRDPEWGVGMLEDIAAIVGDTERSLDNPSGEPTWMRH
jgi:hypothetical protein